MPGRPAAAHDPHDGQQTGCDGGDDHHDLAAQIQERGSVMARLPMSCGSRATAGQAAGRSTWRRRLVARSTSSPGATGDPERTTWASCRVVVTRMSLLRVGRVPSQAPCMHSRGWIGTWAQPSSTAAMAWVCD